MAKPDIKRIRDLITEFDNAAQEYAFRGAARPDDEDIITASYINARRKLEDAIGKAAGLDFRAPNVVTRKAVDEARKCS